MQSDNIHTMNQVKLWQYLLGRTPLQNPVLITFQMYAISPYSEGVLSQSMYLL